MGVSERILVQVLLLEQEPMGIFVDTYGTSKVNLTDGEIAETVKNMPCFNLKPSIISRSLKILFIQKTAYGHMGREPEIKTVSFNIAGIDQDFEVETFTWEKLDCQEEIKSAFIINKILFLRASN